MVRKKPSGKTLALGLVVTALSTAALVMGTLGDVSATARGTLDRTRRARPLHWDRSGRAEAFVVPLAHLVGLPGSRLGGATAGSPRRTRCGTPA